MIYLTDQEIRLWETAMDAYRETDTHSAIAMVADLAKAEYAQTMEAIRSNPEYGAKIEKEAPIYARYLLTTYAIKLFKA